MDEYLRLNSLHTEMLVAAEAAKLAADHRRQEGNAYAHLHLAAERTWRMAAAMVARAMKDVEPKPGAG